MGDTGFPFHRDEVTRFFKKKTLYSRFFFFLQWVHLNIKFITVKAKVDKARSIKVAQGWLKFGKHC